MRLVIKAGHFSTAPRTTPRRSEEYHATPSQGPLLYRNTNNVLELEDTMLLHDRGSFLQVIYYPESWVRASGFELEHI
jgi:hypothetical protein